MNPWCLLVVLAPRMNHQTHIAFLLLVLNELQALTARVCEAFWHCFNILIMGKLKAWLPASKWGACRSSDACRRGGCAGRAPGALGHQHGRAAEDREDDGGAAD